MNDFNQPEEQNKKKLFVGNLPFSTTEEELTDLFAQYGEVVSVNIITDKFSGRSKGFAFVEFTTEEAAQAAVDGLAGKDFNGRDMVVNVAMPRAPRDDRGGFNRRPGGNNRGGFGGNRSFDRGNNRGGFDRGNRDR